jgi:TetR/AcrR family transcriptional regulator
MICVLMKKENASHNRMSAADRQRQLLEIAMNAFSRRGFKGATTKEIAAAAGVTEAVIFQHFPSKEALYSAVLELHLDTRDEEKWIEEVNSCMECNDDEGVFRSFIRRILLTYRCDPMIERVILFAALEGHEQGLARMQRQFAPILERFMEYIARRQREGALADCNPQAIMIGLGGVAHQYGLITQIFRAPIPDISDEEMAQQFTRILLHGVQATPSASDDNSKIRKPVEQSNRKANK